MYTIDGEATFNDLLIIPFLNAVANVIAKETSSGAEFKMGEAPLIAMKKQLKDDDDVNLYRADSIIKLYSLRELEVLLLETLYHFGSKDKTKASFDHHNGLSALCLCLRQFQTSSTSEQLKCFQN